MALIIDERVAGGRPQKQSTPELASLVSAATRVTDHVRLGPRPVRRQPARRVFAWARA